MDLLRHLFFFSGLYTHALSFVVDFRIVAGYFTSFKIPLDFAVTSGFQCAVRCQLLTEFTCSFALFDKVANSCRLYNWNDIRKLILHNKKLSDSKWVFVATDGKNVYVEHKRNGFDITIAEQKCNQVGGTLANTTDIVRAAENGRWSCACGYTTNAIPYYYVADDRSPCTLGLHECHWDHIGAHCKIWC